MSKELSISRKISKALGMAEYLRPMRVDKDRPLKMRCPLCKGGESLMVSVRKNRFRCRFCEAQGGVLEYHMAREGITRIEAIHQLAGKAGLIDDPGMPHRVLSAHTYADESGKPMTRVVRLEDGGSPQYHLTSKGQWEPGVAQYTRRVPYRLLELLKASELYVCETEAEADALAGLGLAATCFAGGLGGWRSEFEGHFRGKDVFILHRDEVGKPKDIVAAGLVDVTRTVRTVGHANLAVGGEGLVQWVADSRVQWGMTDEAIKRELVEGASRVDEWAGDEPDCLMTVEEVIKRSDITTRWLIPQFLPKNAVVMISGAPGSMKTFLALAIASSVADCKPFLGRGPEVALTRFIAGEGDPSTHRRYFDLLGINAKSASRHWLDIDGQAPPKLPDEKYLRIARRKALIILDSLIRFIPDGADENSAVEMRHVTEALQEIKAQGGTVVALHHSAKSENSQFRGSSELAAGVDILYVLKKPNEGRLELECCKSRFGPLFKLFIDVVKDGDRLMFVDATEAQKASKLDEDANIAKELARIIGESEGLSKKAIVEAAAGLEITKQKAERVLKENVGELWRRDRGARNSYAYFLIQKDSDTSTVDEGVDALDCDYPDPADIG